MNEAEQKKEGVALEIYPEEETSENKDSLEHSAADRNR